MNTLSQQDLATLQSLPPGSYKVIVHQLQNPSGQDASYEQQLVNARATAVQNAIPGSKISVERGENVQGPNAQVEIVKI